MGLLKTYSILNDTASGEIDINKLSQELKDSNDINNYAGVTCVGDNINLFGGSFADETGADSVVSSHEKYDLEEYKQLKYNAINIKTGSLILSGAVYDSATFSCNESAMITYEDILNDNVNATGKYVYPLDLTTLDYNTYTLAEANVIAFTDAVRNHIKGHKDSGRALLKSVFDAVDKAGVDAVTDNR